MLGSRRARAALIVLALLVLAAPAAHAARVEADADFLLPAGETHAGNLYAFGTTVRIEGTVQGDLVAAGTSIVVASGGRVEGDLLAAGQGVLVEGEVEGDVRAAGFTVQIGEGGSVGGELTAAGFSIGVADGASAGEVMAVGYQGLLDGDVGGDVRFAGSALELNGRVDGDVDASVDAPSSGSAPNIAAFSFISERPPRMADPGIRVAEDAEVRGDLSYESPAESDIEPGAVGGDTSFEALPADVDEDEPAPDRPWAVEWLIEVVKDYVALLVVGLLVVFLAPRLLGEATAILRSRPAPSIGWGVGTAAVALLLAFVVPAVAVVLLILIDRLAIGPLGKPVIAWAALTLAVVTAGLYALSWVGRIVAGTWMGRWIARATGRGAADGIEPVAEPRPFLPMAVGLLIYAILSNLPFGLGFLLNLIIVLFGLGAVVAWLWGYWSARRTLVELPA